MNECIIAVDVGEKSTVAVAYKLNREVLLERVYKNSKNNNIHQSRDIISQLIKEIQLLDIEFSILCIYFGVHAWNKYKEKKKITDEFQEIFNTRVRIEDRSYIGLFTVLKDRSTSGILAISNANSVCYGIYDNHIVKTGGWGPYINNRGSAYHVIMELFKKITDDADRGENLSDTAQLLMETLEINSLEDLLQFSNSDFNVEKTIKRLIKLAIEGSKEVRHSFKEAGKEMANLVLLTYKRFPFKENIIIGVGGYVLLRSPYVQDAFMETIKKELPRANFDLSNTPRVMGAYYMALRDIRIGSLKTDEM